MNKTEKRIEKLEKKIQKREDFFGNPEPDTIDEAFEEDKEQIINDFQGLLLKKELQATKQTLKEVGEVIDKFYWALTDKARKSDLKRELGLEKK